MEYLLDSESIYDKIDSNCDAMMSINAVKSVEIGAGPNASEFDGAFNADEISVDENHNIQFSSNNSGGSLEVFHQGRIY